MVAHPSQLQTSVAASPFSEGNSRKYARVWRVPVPGTRFYLVLFWGSCLNLAAKRSMKSHETSTSTPCVNLMLRPTLPMTLWVIIALLLCPEFIGSTAGQKNAPPLQQDNKPAVVPENLLKRTMTRRENMRLGYGGTVTIVGAPNGSITVEGWSKSEVEVIADLELNAPNEDDLNRLAVVNNVAIDSDSNHIRILTTGTHDKAFMRRAAKNFPKNLIGLPWRVDYQVRVPAVTDMDINAGQGDIKLSGVEGAIRLTATQGETTLVLTGGALSATVTAGDVLLKIPSRSWRGDGVDVRLAAGTLTVELPPGFSGDIDADILRSGNIEDSYGALGSRERPGITSTIMRARAGAGGPFFKFTVGVGTVSIRKLM